MESRCCTDYGDNPCKTVNNFIERLVARGFTMLNEGNWNYEEENFPVPNADRLFYKLESPVDLDEIDLTDETYCLAHLGSNVWMCEWHYNLVKLVQR